MIFFQKLSKMPENDHGKNGQKTALKIIQVLGYQNLINNKEVTEENFFYKIF